ncbi:iron dicitrate transport regulator FecR [Bordetella genomosp. 1]|uniref:Iron dicitrate transport regulator FecR n=1 Tax=Bordetella genomosp. 1 TaxID=1395607 RepID=A0A261RWN2_9BORD|nr:FecR domain-containing protein [Bordetella genomosp. 1]OZI29167.1 iron dicitrate transport regulator FecR [Bordetella genomosp. 1]
MSAQPALPPEVLRQAADWLVRLQCGELQGEQARAFDAWHSADARHAEAWERARALLGHLAEVPAPVGAPVLRDAARRQRERRRLLRGLAGLAIVAPAAWSAARLLPWTAWSADLRSATGEIRHLSLADGTRVVLASASALDVLYSDTQRLLWLRAGEILVETAADRAGRPFRVRTAQGELRALGTRFTVRIDGDETALAVYDGAVEVSPAGGAAPQIVQAGHALAFSEAAAGRQTPALEADAAWTRGMLAVHERPLGEVLAKIARYRRGVLRCDPAVAGMRVSGAFPLTDTDASLALLARTLPVRIDRLTPYWVSVRAVEAEGT